MRLDVENISSMEEHFDDYMKSVVSLLTGVLFTHKLRQRSNQPPTSKWERKKAEGQTVVATTPNQ